MDNQNSEDKKARKPRKARAKSLKDIVAEIAELEIEKEKIINDRADLIARLVIDSGLAALDISDRELKAKFKELADSFRKSNG